MRGRIMNRCCMSHAPHLSPLCPAVVPTVCGTSGDDESQQWMQQAHQSVSTTVLPLPELKPYAPHKYMITKQVDPLSTQRVAELSRAQNESPEPNCRCEPLEDHPLEVLRLVRTIKRNGETEAVVSVGGKTQHVHMGQHIRQDHGHALCVGDQEFILCKLVREGTTEWKRETTTLKVQKSVR